MKDMVRFIFTLDRAICKEIRKQAYSRNISMATYVLQAIVMRINNDHLPENEDDQLEEIKTGEKWEIS